MPPALYSGAGLGSCLKTRYGTALPRNPLPRLTRRPAIRDFLDLTAIVDTPVDWTYEPWIERDAITMFGGEGGSRKSWLALDMAIAMAAGQAWLGMEAREPMPVIILDQDTGETITKRRILDLCSGRGLKPADLKDSLFILPRCGFKIDTDLDRAELIARCRERSARYVIADALVAIHKADENDARDMARIIRDHFGALTTHAGVGILVIHHMNKPNEQAATALHRMRGSGEIVNASDCVISFKASSELIKMSLERSRSAAEEEWPDPIHFTIDRDPDAKSARIMLTAPQTVQAAVEAIRAAGLTKASIRDTLAALKSAGQPFSFAAIQRAKRRLR